MKRTTFTRILLIVPSTFFFIAMIVVGVAHSSAYLLAFFLPYEKRYQIARTWGGNSIRAVKLFCRLGYRLHGTENLPAKDQPVIIFAKHQSAFEIMLLMSMMGPTSWVAKKEILKIPIFGPAFGASKPICLDRSAGRSAVTQLIQQGEIALREGRNILIFPEGTRTAPGSKPNYRIGGAILAEKTAYPILPIAHNAGEFWPRHAFIKWPGTVDVHIGPLIETHNKNAEQIRSEVQAWIEGKVAEISDPSRWQKKTNHGGHRDHGEKNRKRT